MSDAKERRYGDWLGEQLDEVASIQSAIRETSDDLVRLAAVWAEQLRRGHQIFFFGNGGSAADAQHWAAELSGRFYKDRVGLPGLALTTNTSALTAIANDYDYAEIFARQLRGSGKRGDIAVGISTSGTSANVVRALEVGQEMGLITVGFCGANPGPMSRICDHVVSIPSTDVARIQEGHEICAHLVISVVERILFDE